MSSFPPSVRGRAADRPWAGEVMSTLLRIYLVVTAAAGSLLLTTMALQACTRAVRRVVRPTTP